MKEDKIEKLQELARKMNEREKIDILDVPIINGFEIQKNSNPSILFIAVSQDKFMEQLVFDKQLEERESLDERISLIIEETKINMQRNNLENPNNSLRFYKEYHGLFNFKIYLQDNLMNKDNKKILIRQFNVYFLEPKNRNVYQLTLSSCPIDPLKINLEKVNQDLERTLIPIISNIKYK